MTIRNITKSTLIASAVLVGSMTAMTTASYAICHSPLTVHAPGTSVFWKNTKYGAKNYAKATWKRQAQDLYGRDFRKVRRARNRSGSYRVSSDGKKWIFMMTATPCD